MLFSELTELRHLENKLREQPHYASVVRRGIERIEKLALEVIDMARTHTEEVKVLTDKLAQDAADLAAANAAAKTADEQAALDAVHTAAEAIAPTPVVQ